MSESPFGPAVQKYWDRRYALFKRFDDGIQIDKEGLYSVCPEDVAMQIAARLTSQSVYDAFGGVGGNAIAFALSGKQVTCSDTDQHRLNFAQHNATVYGVPDKITFVCGDYFELAPTVDALAVFLDPPWGGPDYINEPAFRLEHFSPSGIKILECAFLHFSEVVLRVPRTFAFEEFAQFGKVYTVEDNVSEGRIISRTVFFK